LIIAKVQEWIQILQSTVTGTGPSKSQEEVLPLLSSVEHCAAPTGKSVPKAAKVAASPSFKVPVDSIVASSLG
jgi:hypothetical protein